MANLANDLRGSECWLEFEPETRSIHPKDCRAFHSHAVLFLVEAAWEWLHEVGQMAKV